MRIPSQFSQRVCPLLLLSLFPLVAGYGDLSRSRLSYLAEHSLTGLTSHAISQASIMVDNVVDDLLTLDSQNSVLIGYLNKFDKFIAISGNHTKETLEFFYDIVDDYLDADVAEKTLSIETQLIALCLQRNGFDRWKRTIQLRLTQLHKSFEKKLKTHMNTVDREERLAIENRWSLVTARGGARRIEKFRQFVEWLGA